MGTLIQIEIEQKEQIQLRIYETVRIVWFGRTLGASVVSLIPRDQNIVLILEIEGCPVALHLDSYNQPAIKSFVGLTQREETFRCSLTAVSDSVNLIFTVRDVNLAADFFTKVGETFAISGNSLIFKRGRVKDFLQSKVDRFRNERCGGLEVTNDVRVQLD